MYELYVTLANEDQNAVRYGRGCTVVLTSFLCVSLCNMLCVRVSRKWYTARYRKARLVRLKLTLTCLLYIEKYLDGFHYFVCIRYEMLLKSPAGQSLMLWVLAVCKVGCIA